MNFFFQSLIAFLPKRYRWKLLRGGEVSPAAAIASGVAQTLVFFVLLARYYLAFAHHWLQAAPDEVTYGAYSASGEPGLMGVGVFMLFSFVLQPLTLLLAYFVAEGASRILGVAFTGEIRGSLAIWLVEIGQEKAAAWREERKLGARVVDEVEAVGSDGNELRIASCRAKADWDERVTIAYQQGLYEVAAQERGVAPRPFLYVLRKKPEFKVIRGLRHYSPEEGLRR